MLSEEQIEEAKKLSEESEVVKVLFDFYTETQKDGLKALRISLNKKLIDISASVDSAQIDDNDDKTFERIDRIVTSLKKLPNESRDKDQNHEHREGHEGKALF